MFRTEETRLHHQEVEMSRKLRVLVEVRADSELAAAAGMAMAGAEVGLPGPVSADLGPLEWDRSFAPVPVTPVEGDAGAEGAAPFAFVEGITVAVRGEVDEDQVDALRAAAHDDPRVVGLFADPAIAATPVCPGDPPVGTAQDVEELLCVERLHEQGMRGKGVLVVVVDGGLNRKYLEKKGKKPGFDAGASFSSVAGVKPGQAKAGHGTMVAFDACIAAPDCTLADVAILQPKKFDGLLSDALSAYGHLQQMVGTPGFFDRYRGIVVNNSWAMFDPDWDFPVGDPENYSDNPNHLFNVSVAALERLGADIVFAAGNCGPECPDKRCKAVTSRTIYGANSHPAVLSVAGVDTRKQRVGYSSTGPGRLSKEKPDLCCYTHFAGSGVYAADSGTSAAAPVAAGVIAALRSRFRYDRSRPATAPAAMRRSLIRSSDAQGGTGHSAELGWGILDGCRLPIGPPT